MSNRADTREDARKPRVVIIGGGFGGAYCAQALQRLLGRRDVEVVLLDRHNYFVFYPLLVEAGTGSLEPRHAVISLREFLKGGRFLMADVVDIDPSAHVVRYRLTASSDLVELNYDHLVFAVGSVTLVPAIPGLEAYGFQLKSLADAVSLRDRAIRMLEWANITSDSHTRQAMLRFVVVGASFTGVEVAGEFFDFLRNAAGKYPNVHRRDISMTLVERENRILPALDADLADYALDRMQRWGIDVRINETVSEIQPEQVRLTSGDTLATRTVIWCAGIAPNPIVERLPFATDARGYLLTERDLRICGFPDIWGIGDCAVNPDAEGHAYPATAQHAVRQGKQAAGNIARVLKGQDPQPCDIKSRGSLVALGCRTGVARVFGVKLSGFAAWWLHRTVYLTKMPGVARKLRIALDWTMDLIFPRDYVQLDVLRPHPARVARYPNRTQTEVGDRQQRDTPRPDGPSSTSTDETQVGALRS
ncbi:MAG: NAD(P)/FAD-dependent oxidoreductase [Phycisphaerae bacterium]|jgi:NADH dehydrogenase